MNNIPIPENYNEILLKPEHNILIMGDKVGEFAGGLVNLRYQQMVPDEDNTSMDECWRAWEKALSSIYVLVPTRPDWLGTLTMLDLDREKDKDFIKKHILELDLIGDISTDDLNELADKIRRQTGVDKFDFIIGNPPYQKNIKNSNRYKPIYPNFMDLSYLLSNKAVLITPARFLFNAGFTSKKWNEKMLNNSHLKVLKYFPNSKAVFSNADVKGGIAVTLKDDTQDFGKIKIYIPNPTLRSIFNKVWNAKFESFESLVSSSGLYHFSDYFFKKIPNATEINGKGTGKMIATNSFEKFPNVFTDYPKKVKMLGLLDHQRTYKYINFRYVENNSYLNKYKVFIPKANGSGALGESLSTPLVGEPLVGATGTFLNIGPFNTKKEAENCLKYIKSKFARAMLGILKITQDNTKPKWQYVPMQDFSDNSDINWNVNRLMLDQQFYNKYNLTLHESTWIEDHIKEMD